MSVKDAAGFFLIFLVTTQGIAQRYELRREIRAWRLASKDLVPLSVSARGSATQFWGELNRRNTSRAWGGGVQAHLKDAEAFSLGLDVHTGRLTGRKKKFFHSYFIHDFVSVEFIPRFDIIRSIRRDPEQKVSLNLYAGVGLTLFSADAYDLDTGERVRFTNDPEKSGRNPLFQKYGTPKGKIGIRKTHERIIPVGAAISYALSKGVGAGLDIRYYLARTDKLDATSGMRLTNPEEAESYSCTPNERYSTLTVFMNYRFLRNKRK